MSKVQLRQRVAFEYGYAVRINAEKQGEYPVFGSNGATGYIDSFKEFGPGVIIGRKGSVGKVVYTDENFTPTDTAYFLRILDTKKDDLKFWYYFLPILGIHKLNTHSAVPGLSRELAYLIEADIPPIGSQQKIAAVLSALDAKIDCNKRINAELEAMAKALYDYWFVQFDFPDAHGKPYKSSGGKMVYNASLKREIPQGWGSKKIGEYAEVLKGDLITAKDAKDGSIKVVAAGIDFSYNHSESNRAKNTITISGSGANAGFINFWREPIFASDCITVRGATDTETLLLLYHLRFIQNHILSQATGSAQPHVYPSDIRGLDYVIPRGDLIDDFGKTAIPMNDQVAKNLAENQQLAQLRDWLLPLLMNGQVTVDAS